MFRLLDLEFPGCLEIIKNFSQPFFRGLSVYLDVLDLKQLRRMISLPTTTVCYGVDSLHRYR